MDFVVCAGEEIGVPHRKVGELTRRDATQLALATNGRGSAKTVGSQRLGTREIVLGIPTALGLVALRRTPRDRRVEHIHAGRRHNGSVGAKRQLHTRGLHPGKGPHATGSPLPQVARRLRQIKGHMWRLH